MADFDFGGLLGNLGSAFSGGGPGALDEYLTPEQKAAMQRNAMLQASAALLKAGGRSTTRTSLGQALGQALEAGQGGYEKGQTNAMQQILLKQKMDEAKQAAGLRQAISGIFNQPTPGQEVTPEQALAAPGMAPGPTVERAAMIGQPAPAVDSKVLKAGQYSKLAEIYAASGKSEDAARYQKMADDLNPPEQVQGAPFPLTDQSGKPIMVQQMKNGKIMSLIGFGPPREIEMQNVGGKIVAVDKSKMVAGQGLDVTMTPYQAAQLDLELKRIGMSREELDNKIKMDAARLGISQQELNIAIQRLGLSKAEYARGNYEVKESDTGFTYVPKAPGMPTIPVAGAGGEALKGKQPPPAEAFMKGAKQLNDLSGALEDYKQEITSGTLTFPTNIPIPFTDTGVKLPTGKDTARISGKYNSLLMGVKNLYELGALTGPDMAIIERQLTNPASFSGALTSKGAMLEQVKVVEDMLGRAKQNISGSYRQPMPPAAPVDGAPKNKKMVFKNGVFVFED